MMKSSTRFGLIFLLLAVCHLTSFVSTGHRCQYVQQDVEATSNETAEVIWNCVSTSITESPKIDQLLSKSHKRLVVRFVNCRTIPVGLFRNVSQRLETLTVVSDDVTTELLQGTFDGLDNIKELSIRGFRSLNVIHEAVFCPLRRIEKFALYHAGSSSRSFSYATLGVAMRQLSNTPLRSIVMHDTNVWIWNKEILDVCLLFQLRNVSVRQLTFSDNVIVTIRGELSQCLPDLEYVCIGIDSRYADAFSITIELLFGMRRMQTVVFYGFPEGGQSRDINPIHDTIFSTVFNEMFISLLQNITKIDPQNYVKYIDYNCYLNLTIPLFPTIRSLSAHGMRFLESTIDKPLCFHESNALNNLDLSGSQLPARFPPMTGLSQLRTLSLAGTDVKRLSCEFLKHFPLLQTVSLARMPLHSVLEGEGTDIGRFLRFCPNLRTVDFGESDLMQLSPITFDSLHRLESLNLSGNQLTTFDVALVNCSNLSVLNISHNAITSLLPDTIGQLNAIAIGKRNGSERLQLDLSKNMLSCQCDSVQFINWIKSSPNGIVFPSLESYTCQYPNGRTVLVRDVDVAELEDLCKVVREFVNGSRCPCDALLRSRLQLVRKSLERVYCFDEETGHMASLSVLPFPTCYNAYRRPSFIIPITVVCLLVVMATVGEILNMRRIGRFAVRWLLRKDGEADDEFRHDVFLYITDSEDASIRETCRRQLEAAQRRLATEDDVDFGDVITESVPELIVNSRWIVLVLTSLSVVDQKFMEVVECSLMIKPRSIVPIVWENLENGGGDVNNSLAVILRNNLPLYWRGDGARESFKDAFWKELLMRTAPEFSVASLLKNSLSLKRSRVYESPVARCFSVMNRPGQRPAWTAS